MNIFSRITAKTMAQSRTRTIVTIIGVILSTAMITAVTTFGVSFQKFLVDYSISRDGNWHICVKSLTPERAEEIRDIGPGFIYPDYLKPFRSLRCKCLSCSGIIIYKRMILIQMLSIQCPLTQFQCQCISDFCFLFFILICLKIKRNHNLFIIFRHPAFV